MKKLLIIKATDDLCAQELDQLIAVAGMFGLSHTLYEFTTGAKFVTDLQSSAEKYDYIYLGAHANPVEFGDSQGKIRMPWETFGYCLCSSMCLNSGCVLLLGCCRGGLKPVAKTLFASCAAIDYVCGPRWTVKPCDITLGFHVFIYNMEARNEQPSVAVSRASQACGYDFFCYDRVEMEDDKQFYYVPMDQIIDYVKKLGQK